MVFPRTGQALLLCCLSRSEVTFEQVTGLSPGPAPWPSVCACPHLTQYLTLSCSSSPLQGKNFPSVALGFSCAVCGSCLGRDGGAWRRGKCLWEGFPPRAAEPVGFPTPPGCFPVCCCPRACPVPHSAGSALLSCCPPRVVGTQPCSQDVCSGSCLSICVVSPSFCVCHAALQHSVSCYKPIQVSPKSSALSCYPNPKNKFKMPQELAPNQGLAA